MKKNMGIMPYTPGKTSGKRGAHDASAVCLSGTEHRILIACGEGLGKASELPRTLGYESRTGNFKRSLNRLLDSRIPEKNPGSVPRSRNQKYRLADKSRAIASGVGAGNVET